MKKILLALAFIVSAMSMNAQQWSKELVKAAKNGDAEAQYQVGLCYYEGNGVEKDEKKAAEWFFKSMNLGNDEARTKFYSFWSKPLEKMAKKGDAEAQHYLGLCYYNGSGIAQDKEIAGEWFMKSYKNGNIEARKILYSYENRAWKSRMKTYTSDDMELRGGDRVDIKRIAQSVIEGELTYMYIDKAEFEKMGLTNDGPENGWGFAEGSYIKIAIEDDTICGFINGDIIEDATFKHKNDWMFEGDIRTNLLFIYKQAFTAAKEYISGYWNWTSIMRDIETTFLTGGKMTNYGSKKSHGRRTWSDDLKVWSTEIAFTTTLEEDVIMFRNIDPYTPDKKNYIFVSLDYHPWKAKGKDTFLVPYSLWSSFFEPNVFTNMPYGKFDDFAYGEVEYLTSPEGTSIQGYNLTLPNGARIISNGKKSNHTYYPAGSKTPLSLEKGEMTISSNIKMSWEKKGYDEDNDEIYDFNFEAPDGRKLYFTGNFKYFNIYNLQSLANGMKVFLLNSEAKEAGIEFPEYWKEGFIVEEQIHFGNGLITYLDGSEEKIINGERESIIKEREAIRKAEEAEEKKIYDDKCAKYGKVYVDAAADGELMIGMHWDLVQEFCKGTLGIIYIEHWVTYSDGTSVFYINDYQQTLAKVFVKNNKITDFVYY